MQKLLFSALLAASSASYATQFGVGVGIVEGGQSIYFPVNISNDIRLEPYLIYSRNKTNYDFSPSTGSNDYTYTSNYTNVGLGIFKVLKQSNETNLYFGARVGSIKTKNNTVYADPTIPSYPRAGKGFTVAPVAGFEYYLNPNLSLSAEISISHYHQKSTDSLLITKSNWTSTETGIRAKYYFK